MEKQKQRGNEESEDWLSLQKVRKVHLEQGGLPW